MSSASSTSILKGILRIIAVGCLLIGTLYGADCAVRHGLLRLSRSSFGASNQIMRGEVNAEIVISGSSRARSHYDSLVIQNGTRLRTFNIGRIGAQTDMQLAFLTAYLQHNAKPALVIHNLDLFSFLTSREIYEPAQYLPYIEEDAIYTGIRRVYPDAWKWKYLPLYGYVVPDMRLTWISGLKGLIGFQPAEDHVQGYLPRFTQWTEDFENFKKSHPQGVTTEIEQQGIDDLIQLVKLCRARGIALLFVYSPEYHEMQSLERNRKEIFAAFREISERYNVPLWDYSDSAICQQRDYFYNSQHLNADGAAIFSGDLARRLVESSLLQ